MKKDLFKKICGSFTTGVTVITSNDKMIDYGFTASSFTSVSIDPLLILFCLNKEAKSNIALKNKSFFIVNILNEKQINICNQFADNKLKPEERFRGVKTKNSNNQIKKISDSIAFLECQVTEKIEAGDHYIYIGKVIEGEVNKNLLKPLIYQNGLIKNLL
jgi:flavin reductase (DIM6/NTAB) family NADH-FMN oxidoreductase RutF